ncbi:MAG TPA: homoserine dehydrogenase [Polyangiaceae bacterium]|nr:homoserine dehydrogenase [Polyangiaceae bacterium]
MNSSSALSSGSPAQRPVRIAILGSGTVGGGVLRLLHENRDALAQKVGAPLEVAHVLVRDASKPRVPECRPEWVTTDPERVFGDPELDVVIEVIGGENPARSYIERAIDRGLTVVSANKFVLAKHGPALLERAQRAGVDLAFEASVGGGIPIIRTLREALTGDTVESIHGILNGTCNYILTKMRREGLGFAEVLAEAQALGYAEADPTLDVEGFDAAQKLIVASMLAFGSRVGVDEAPVEGISAIDDVDFTVADRFGFTIKHLAIGRDLGDELSLRTHAALVPKTSVLAGVDGVLNCVYIRGRALGPCMLVGRGAGDLPTAVSVVADLVDVARSRLEGDNGLSTRGIFARPRKLQPLDELVTRYYLRFDLSDSPGVLGVLATTLGRHGVSIEQMVQERNDKQGQLASVLIITHATREGAVRGALAELAEEPFLQRSPRFLRIEDIG